MARSASISLWQYRTPVFEPDDPLVCHPVTLRPSLWERLWNELGRLGLPETWDQQEPGAATPQECADEFQAATDEAALGQCLMPIGEVKWIATDIPSWALLCDGSVYLKAAYPALAAIIHSAYDVDATHFQVPNLIGRFPYGAIAPGAEGGQDEVTLTVAQMPAHSHAYSSAGLPELPVVVPGEGLANALQEVAVTTSVGGGDAHPNIPPYHSLIPVIVAFGYLPPITPGVETGMIQPWPTVSPPVGWLLCDGAAVSRTTYDVLFALIGVGFGPGDGTTTFNLPDMRGRAFVGMDNMGTGAANRVANPAADVMGGSMGAELHTLTISEMPAHHHGRAATGKASGSADAVRDPGANYNSSDTGGGQAHNNMQPSLFGAWIIKT